MNFEKWNEIEPGFLIDEERPVNDSQVLTNDAFSEKWKIYSKEEISEQEKLLSFKENGLDLYGFNDERHLAEHLRNFKYILDAGCGLGYKAAWFASLALTARL